MYFLQMLSISDRYRSHLVSELPVLFRKPLRVTLNVLNAQHRDSLTLCDCWGKVCCKAMVRFWPGAVQRAYKTKTLLIQSDTEQREQGGRDRR